MTPRSSKWPMTCPMTLRLFCGMGYSWSPEGSRSYSLTHSWALPESAKHNNGIHPTPHHGASHASCVGARVMPGG